MLLPLLLSLVATAPQEEAKSLLDRMEKKVKGAKNLRFHLTATLTNPARPDRIVKVDGDLWVKEGDRYRIALVMETDRKQEINGRSNGKESDSLIGGKSKRRKTEKGITPWLMATFTRSGYLAMFLAVQGRTKNANNEAPKPDPDMVLADLKMAGKEAINGVDLVILEYTSNLLRKLPVRFRLWINPETLNPVKRVAIVENQRGKFTITEIYSQISTKEIPDLEFALDK